MKKTLFILLALLTFQLSFSQAPGCNGSRYIDTTFLNYSVVRDIQFGSNTTIGGNNKNLFMDIFKPKDDPEINRPLIILAFGGSFISGTREDLDVMAIGFAQRGYVVSSIDYRLYDKLAFIDSALLIDVVVKGMGDMKAAVRFFKQDYSEQGNTYGIDTNYIFAGGVSSGAILACHVGLVSPNDDIPTYFQSSIDANGGWEGNSNSNSMEYSSNITGVLSFSGALKETEWITESEVPVFLVHDTADTVVPYERGQSVINIGTFSIPLVYVSGGKEMYDALQNNNIKSQLLSVPSKEHVSYFQGETVDTFLDSVWKSSTIFIESIICDATWGINDSDLNFSLSPNPTKGILNINSKIYFNSISVFDQVGRLVKKPDSNMNFFNISNLSEGYYFVQISTDTGTKTKKVLLK